MPVTAAYKDSISDRSNRKSWIDSLKGVALLGVLVLHTGGENLPGFLGDLGREGARGVQLFLILSVYLTCKSLAKTNLNRSGRADWLIGRFFRIAPLYYLAILLSMLGRRGGYALWLGSEKTVSVLNVLSHIFFMNGLNPYYIDSIVGVEWYIADLVLFYVFAVFFFKWINTFEKAVAWLVLSTILSYIVSGAAYLITFGSDDNIWIAYVSTFSLVAELPVIFLGVVLYHFLEFLKTRTVPDKRLLSYALGFFSIYVCFVLATSNVSLNGAANTGISNLFLFGCAFFVLIISQYLMPWKILDNIVLRKLGEHSYGIYLFHLLFIDLYNEIMETYGISFPPAAAWGIRLVIILLVSYPFAVLTDRYIGKPMLSVGKSILSRRQLRRGVTN